MQNNGQTLYCSNMTCRVPVVKLAHDAIIVKVRHHGSWHEFALDLHTQGEEGWPHQKDVLPVNPLGEPLRR